MLIIPHGIINMSMKVKTLLLLFKKPLWGFLPKDIKNLITIEFIILDYGLNKAFIFFIGSTRLDWVRYLIEEKGADIHFKSDYAIIYASSKGRFKTVKYLLEKGCDVHTDDDLALINACREGHLEVIKCLIDNGANVHSRNDLALVEASLYGHLDIVKYLVEQGSNANTSIGRALKYASIIGYSDVVKYLMKK